uniref:18S rRNA (guanine-N(7))-methyltransferase n=1 Tax=Evadne anonyx TaxID=141404 RepID=A0A9N6WXN3_9CRUS|nr:EOG090X0BBW [Evadne anonyx]
MSGRPEHRAPPEIFYNEDEARKYTRNTRMIEIQMTMSERAVELLGLPEDQPCHLLDLGCGSGLSGEFLSEQGHTWVGVDISDAMLNVAKEKEVEGDVALVDLGQGLPFRAGAFDGAISISALQWLCNADKTSHNPAKRLNKLFSTLYSCLSLGSRAVFQFYPENSAQMELITSQSMKAGFSGGIVVDYPNSTKAKKYFLVLMTTSSATKPDPFGQTSLFEQVGFSGFTHDAFDERHVLPQTGAPPSGDHTSIFLKNSRSFGHGDAILEHMKYELSK